MSGKLFTSSENDKNGRKFLTSDVIGHVLYYDSSSEEWDRSGDVGQSWATELSSPNDAFDEENVNSSRWATVGGAVSLIDRSLHTAVNGGEGVSGITSEGKWALSGDFEIRLYIDWDTYYNEYRSVTYSFLRVSKDNSNSARIGFKFNGVGSYSFVAEKAVDRDLRFFDWKPSGPSLELSAFTDAANQELFKIKRTDGVIQLYVSNGTTDTQIGSDITDSVFSDDLYVDAGVETKEYNTLKHSFNKFFVVSGGIFPELSFFSSIRGPQIGFPEIAVITVDNASVSIIDEEEGVLWLRFPINDFSLLKNDTIRIAACEGILYFATDLGLIVVDFPQDKIYRYINSEIQLADESIALRNTSVIFRTHKPSTGDMPSNVIHDVDCLRIGNSDYVALAHDEGVSVRRLLASGISNCTDGPVPGKLVTISERASLHWSGYSASTNTGELSTFSNVAALAAGGTSPFSRTTGYSTSTSPPILGEIITGFSARSFGNSDQLAVGTTEGITFIAKAPGVHESKSATYGVTSPSENPFLDPTFANPIGLQWFPTRAGLQSGASAGLSGGWVTEGTTSLLLKFDPLPSFGSYYSVDAEIGVAQVVNLTGVGQVYFDINMVQDGTSTGWVFEVLAGGTILKTYSGTDGTFIKRTDSVDTLSFDGEHEFKFRLRFLSQYDGVGLDDNYVYIDNIKTTIGNPKYKELPGGNSNVKDILLQYDTAGHKVYFSTAGGFGAIDLDDNSLDYFTNIVDVMPDQNTEILSADFSRVEDEI